MTEMEDYGLERLVDPPQHSGNWSGDSVSNLGCLTPWGSHHEDISEEKG